LLCHHESALAAGAAVAALSVYLARFASDGSLGDLWHAAVDMHVENNLV